MQNKLVILTLGGALALAAPAFAQDNAAPPQTQSPDQAQGQPGRGPMRMDPERQLQHMTRALSLTPDQQSQLRPLLAERQQKMEAVFQDQSLAGKDRHAKMQAIRQESRSKIEAVLNDQQKQQFESMQERGRGRGGRQGGMPEGGQQPPQ